MTTGQIEASREFGEYDTDADERGTAQPQKGQNDKGPARDRLNQLAQHKEPKSAWYTCVGPKLRFGTQQPMWPVSAPAMAASASPRVQTLATPKQNFQAQTVHEGRPFYYYSVGRSSAIWGVSEEAKHGSSTERLQELAKHKQLNPEFAQNKGQFYYSCGRQSPIWQVDQSGDKQPPERSRTTDLARHRDYHPDFLGERPIPVEVALEAQHFRTTKRLISLAEPVKRPDGPFRNPEWPVQRKALTSVASTRSCELAKNKPLAEGFLPARDMEWPVSTAAKKAVATPRLEALSRPVTRGSMDSVQFDPKAFIVKRSALTGVIPGRIMDLAQPANR